MAIDDFPEAFKKNANEFPELIDAAGHAFDKVMHKRLIKKMPLEAPLTTEERIIFLDYVLVEVAKNLNERLIPVEIYCGKRPAKGRKK